MVSIDQDDSAQILDIVGDFSLDPQSPKLASAVFGSARKRSLRKLKEPSRRDSPTLPWDMPLRDSKKGGVQAKKLPELPKTRPESPDIETILARTPRPRKKASPSTLPSPRSQGSSSTKTSPKIGNTVLSEYSLSSIYSSLLDDDSDREDGGSESDSSIDIHTPLP